MKIKPSLQRSSFTPGLVIFILCVLLFFFYQGFTRPRDVGPFMYVFSSTSGCALLMFCDTYPVTTYWYGTDLSPEEQKRYVEKRAELKRQYPSGVIGDYDAQNMVYIFQKHGSLFRITAYDRNGSEEVARSEGLKTDRSYIVEIVGDDRGRFEQALQ